MSNFVNNLQNVPWYLMLGLVFVISTALAWTIQTVWRDLTGKGK